MLSITCPMYNEAAMVRPFVARIVAIMTALNEPFELVLVNDGSTDATLVVLHELARADARLRVIDLSRNFGKEAALSAALDHAQGDAVVFIDADLQDPPELLAEMLRLWRQGHAVVQVRRAERGSDSWLKRCTARAFYRVHNCLAHHPLPPDVGDFRLIDRQVADALRRLPERQRFMKGLFSWVGFDTVTIDCVRGPRMAGEGKFSGWRLWNLALEAITSFSTLPLRVWTYIGAIVAALAFAYGGYIVVRTLWLGVDVPGYASLLVAILFLGGVQLIGLGIVGEYIGRIYAETKQRPLYIVRSVYRAASSTQEAEVGDGH